MEALDELALALRGRLIERARTGEAGEGLESEVRQVVDAEAGSLPEADRAELRERMLLLATGLGPLEPLLADPTVDEVMVNGPGEVFVERRGRLEATRRAVRGRCRAASRDRARAGAARAAGSTRRLRSATRGSPTARA